MRTGPATAAQVYHDALCTTVLLLAPFTPHLSSECWTVLMAARLRCTPDEVPESLRDVHVQSWPQAQSTSSLARMGLSVVVMAGRNRMGQVEGLDASLAADPARLQEAVLASDVGRKAFEGKTIKRVVAIPQKNNPNIIIMNFVC